MQDENATIKLPKQKLNSWKTRHKQSLDWKGAVILHSVENQWIKYLPEVTWWDTVITNSAT